MDQGETESDPGRPPDPRWVPALPFAFSLLISLSSVGGSVYWQDSGYYLTAVHDLSVLYPHGFVLYLFLCNAWTLLVSPLLGFTLAVHLFSALCAAGAAAFLGAACRLVLLRTGFRRPNSASILAACLWAAGYSFWHSGILAKTYALFYLTLSALLWVLLRAERRSDFTLAALLLALAWLAHPCGALLIPVLGGLAWARRGLWRPWGRAWAASQLLLCAAVALLPLLALPLLASKEQLIDMGDPGSLKDLWYFVRGGRFIDDAGAFGIDRVRLAQASLVLWEEFLGSWIFIGLGAAALMVRARGTALLLLACSGVLTLAALTFRLEGQIDQWLVAAGIFLCPLAAAGIARVSELRSFAGAASAGLVLLWMLTVNFPDLRQRAFDAPTLWGQAVLRSPDPGALVVLSGDDSSAIVRYLHRVRGVRPDLRIVETGSAGLAWYDRRMHLRAAVVVPPWEQAWRSMPGIPMNRFEVTALVNANAGPDRAVFCEMEPVREFLAPGLECVPCGLLWRVGPGTLPPPPAERWSGAEDLDRVASRIGRARGTTLLQTSQGLKMFWESYEQRALSRLASSRLGLAALLLESDPGAAADVLQHAARLHPALEQTPVFRTLLEKTRTPARR